MRVLITGAGGQLGRDLAATYSDHEVTALDHAALDVTDEPAVVAAVRDLAPHLVVHTAAWTDVDGCEADPDRAHEVNALGAWWVARACTLVDATMVHLSTDYVFAGDRGVDAEPYTEFDVAAPTTAYGRSKLAGEVLVRRTVTRHHIVRTAWLAGSGGPNFVRTVLDLAARGEPVSVVDDQVGSPTFTADLATAIREVSVSGRYGTYHRTNGGRATWYDLAATTFELTGLPVDLRRTSSTALSRPAARPAFSVLSDRHSVLSGLSPLPDWRDGLARLLAELGETPA